MTTSNQLVRSLPADLTQLGSNPALGLIAGAERQATTGGSEKYLAKAAETNENLAALRDVLTKGT